MVWIRSLFFTLLGPGTVLIAVPFWILTTSGHRFDIGPARWVGIVPLVFGVGGLVWCIWEFTQQGRGTLAPVDEPRFVVRSGMYRWVRNPMYLSVLTALAGEIILFRSIWLIAWAAGFAVAFTTFVVSWEEPHLARKFGVSYEDYRRSVPRWLPRRPRRSPTIP